MDWRITSLFGNQTGKSGFGNAGRTFLIALCQLWRFWITQCFKLRGHILGMAKARHGWLSVHAGGVRDEDAGCLWHTCSAVQSGSPESLSEVLRVMPYGSPHHDARNNAGVSLHNIGRLGSLLSALSFKYTMVMLYRESLLKSPIPVFRWQVLMSWGSVMIATQYNHPPLVWSFFGDQKCYNTCVCPHIQTGSNIGPSVCPICRESAWHNHPASCKPTIQLLSISVKHQ